MEGLLLAALVATWLQIGLEHSPAFREVGAELGLDFVHQNGMSGKLYTAEIVGPGVALFDYDNDGDLDVYLGQGGRSDDSPLDRWIFPPDAAGRRSNGVMTDRLFRNDLEVRKDGSRSLLFVDVTEESGIAAHGYNMGVATGDFDNDGWVDLYVTNLGPNHLLRNLGDGTFREVTQKAAAEDRRWSVPAVFFDYDADGWLDLFIGNYHRFRAGSGKDCFLPNGLRDYCGPLAYTAEQDRLLRNRGDGTFEDVTVAAGLDRIGATALGAVAADFDGDGRIDLYVANDLLSNHLWLNQGDGTFVEDALLRGAALDRNGKAQASMGVVAGDLDGNGSVDLFMSHLHKEYNTVFLNDGRGMFRDRSREGGLVQASWPMTGFGTVILDYDGDGARDLYVVNGAVHRIEAQIKAKDPHPLRMENQLFRGVGGGRFEEVEGPYREAPVRLEVSRGLAVGDVDNDGDPDLVITNNAGPVRLLLNAREPGDAWLGARLLDVAGKRDVYGARAALIPPATSGTLSQPAWQRTHTDGSFAAASDPRLLFLVPERSEKAGLQVYWPDGVLEFFEDLTPGRYVTVRRGSGHIVERPTISEDDG